MGILKRFKDIMEANINAMLDKAEDPEKMIDQYMRNLTEDLAKVKQETVSVMADETKAKRDVEKCKEEIASLQSYAEKAVLAGNDDDARKFLTQKQQMETKLAALEQAAALAHDNAVKMRQMYDKLTNDISTLEMRRDTIKAKISVAKAQQAVNKVGESMNGVAADLSAFDRMEARADKMLDEANAAAELNKAGQTEQVEDLKAKYDVSSPAVDDELAALKAKMGM